MNWYLRPVGCGIIQSWALPFYCFQSLSKVSYLVDLRGEPPETLGKKTEVCGRREQPRVRETKSGDKWRYYKSARKGEMARGRIGKGEGRAAVGQPTRLAAQPSKHTSHLGWDSKARRWFTIWFWDMSKLPKIALNLYWSKAAAQNLQQVRKICAPLNPNPGLHIILSCVDKILNVERAFKSREGIQ